MKVGYQTASGMYEAAKKPKPPLHMAGNRDRLATGNALVGGKRRTRTQQLAPLPGTAAATDLPASAHTGGAGAGSMRASSHFNPNAGESLGGSTLEKSKLNIVAKKRPPPMNIGFNSNGIEVDRQVLYRNFH